MKKWLTATALIAALAMLPLPSAAQSVEDPLLPDTSGPGEAANAACVEGPDASACPAASGGAVVEGAGQPVLDLASTVDDGPGEEDGAESFLATVPTAGAAIVCAVQTQNPHKSRHVAGTANVVGTNSCPRSVAFQSIRVSLYRSRWYGWEHLDTNKNSCWNCPAVRQNAAGRCRGGSDYYYGESYHYVRDWDGAQGDKWTGNGERFWC